MRLVTCLSSGILCLLVPSLSLGQVPYERLLNAEREPENWLTYSGGYASQRYSALDEITPENVSGLKTAWVYQLSKPGLVETSPIVVDGLMYITEPPSSVTALDARSGRRLWSWSPKLPQGVRHIGFPPVNRGVAILDETLYVGTLDGHLFALDAKSGAERWKTLVGDNATGHAVTVAPLAIDGKVIVGISGGEAGIRGFLDAYDAQTGERLWRFWTIPGPGEPGNDTWAGDSWKTGAGPTWVTGTYDPELDLIYWGTGNPGPDWNGDLRLGDNLYTCCVIALEASTGKLRWHYQFTPHDVHDWDACQVPILVDAQFRGRARKLLVTANRNAFYYVLDRETGEFLHAAPYCKQTWAEGIDEKGRPVLIPGKEPTEKGTLVYPSLQGATNWFSPSYSSRTGAMYVAVRQMGSYYFKTDADYEPGEAFLGGGEQALSGDQASGAIRALDGLTGQQRWEFNLHSPPWAGVMATAGGLVFGGTNEGNFFALDDETGEPLWQFQTGGAIRANPIAFAIDGRQHIAIAAGNALFVFGLP